jgi:NAD(P)-dependent dehydrogenase (short-subunit alcohol dehydrogenase family)
LIERCAKRFQRRTGLKMEFGLKGKTARVLGAGGEFASAIAATLARESVRVASSDRRGRAGEGCRDNFARWRRIREQSFR